MVKTPCFLGRGQEVSFLQVRELRSHMPHGVAGKKKKSLVKKYLKILRESQIRGSDLEGFL